MVHILLVILKFIGILLASILGLLLLLTLIILFAPFGYWAKGEAGEEISFQGRLSWLFAVIQCKVLYEKEQFHWNIRLFGILIASSNEEFQEKRAAKALKKAAKKDRKEQRKANKKKAEQLPDSEREPQEFPEAEEEGTKLVEEVPAKTEESSSPVLESYGETKEPDHIGEEQEPTESFFQKIAGIQEKWHSLYLRLKEKLLNIPDKILSFKNRIDEKKEKISVYLEFWHREATQDAKRRVLGVIKKLLLHVLPDRFEGEVVFGLDDPYRMGQILAILGMLMPIYQDKLIVKPDFEETKLEGRFFLKGKVIPGYLIFTVLGLLLNKNIRKTIKEGKQLIGGN